MAGKWTYESVPGHFAHDYPDEYTLPAVPPRLGLKDKSDDRWDKLFKTIEEWNAADPDTSYKFVLLARHGQGYHNVAELKYGTRAWDDHWSKLNGDGALIWGPDPLLTGLGHEQARLIQSGLAIEAASGLPSPQRRFCSPLSRALDTCDIMFTGVWGSYAHPVVIVEDCREENGVHTCDKRKTRSDIANYKPHFTFEDGFAEHDVLWHPDVRETKEAVSQRAHNVLDMVFAVAPNDSFITITSHEGFIHGFLTAIGRTVFKVPTGGNA